MQRAYLRVFFERVQNFFYIIEALKKTLNDFAKPVTNSKKMKKVLEINKSKLSKKQDIFNSKIKEKNTKIMNLTR